MATKLALSLVAALALGAVPVLLSQDGGAPPAVTPPGATNAGSGSGTGTGAHAVRWQDQMLTYTFTDLPLAEALARMAKDTGQPMRADPTADGTVSADGTAKRAADLCQGFAWESGTDWSWIDNGTIVFTPVPQAHGLFMMGSRLTWDDDEFRGHLSKPLADELSFAAALRRPVRVTVEQPFDDAIRAIASFHELDIVIDGSVSTRRWPVRAESRAKTPLNRLLTVLGWQVGAEWRLAGQTIVFSVAPTMAQVLQTVGKPCPFAVGGLGLDVISERLSKETGLTFMVDPQYSHQCWATTDDGVHPAPDPVLPPLPPMPTFTASASAPTLHQLFMSIPGVYCEYRDGYAILNKDLPDAPAETTAAPGPELPGTVQPVEITPGGIPPKAEPAAQGTSG